MNKRALHAIALFGGGSWKVPGVLLPKSARPITIQSNRLRRIEAIQAIKE
jgi:hypothetical protein